MVDATARLRWRKYGFVLGAWVALGCYEAVQSHTQAALWGRPLSWARAFAGELEYALLAALLTPGVLWVAERFQLPSARWGRVLAAHFGGGAIFASLAKLGWDLFYQPPKSFFAGGITPLSVATSIASGFESGFLMYWIVVAASWAYGYYQSLQAERLAASELQRQFASAQLSALRMQLQPHFLFNTLHTISGLIEEDKLAAERMIAGLSEFLRMSLEAARVPEIPVSDELRFARLYLDIELVRFGDRLQVEYSVDPQTEAAMVPTLILQPLVENAIRHGVCHREKDAKITVRVFRAGDMLTLSVLDNGPGEARVQRSEGAGVGLANTRARLKTRYGDRCQVHLLRFAEGGTEARVVLPFVTAQREEFAVCAS